MRYRVLGKTGLQVSEIGLGAEWLERHNEAEIKEVVGCCESYGVNILDCWMSEPNVRSNIGKAKAGEMDYPRTFWLNLAEWPVCSHPKS